MTVVGYGRKRFKAKKEVKRINKNFNRTSAGCCELTSSSFFLLFIYIWNFMLLFVFKFFFSLDFILGFFTCVIFRFISVSVTPNCTSLFLAYYKFQHIIVISFVSLESLHRKRNQQQHEKKRQQFKWYIFEFPQNPAEFLIIWKFL